MRRSNYSPHLTSSRKTFDDTQNFSYPIPEFGGAYSTNVIVFRSSQATGYQFLEKPFKTSFIAVAAHHHPPLTKDDQLREDFANSTKEKIRTIVIHFFISLVISKFSFSYFSFLSESIFFFSPHYS